MYPNITGEIPKSPPPLPHPSASPYNHQLPPPVYYYAVNEPQVPVVQNVQVVNIVTSGQWSTSLCGCFEDPGNCCITCCCPCIVFGQNAEIIDRNTTSCFCAGLVFYLLCHLGCPCFYSCTYRTKLRGQYVLPETPCGDCLVHCCCTPCAICQEYRELKHRGFDPSIGWIANAERRNRGITTVPPAIVTPPVIVQGMPR